MTEQKQPSNLHQDFSDDYYNKLVSYRIDNKISYQQKSNYLDFFKREVKKCNGVEGSEVFSPDDVELTK